MTSRKKALGFGVLTWLIPFILATPFYGKGEVPMIDIFLIKTILMLSGAGIGCYLLIKYFQIVEKQYLKEAIHLGIIWLLINWLLDLTILLPISGMKFPDYVIQIGLRYLTIPIFALALGILLHQKCEK